MVSMNKIGVYPKLPCRRGVFASCVDF